jgi:uncharacterized protein
MVWFEQTKKQWLELWFQAPAFVRTFGFFCVWIVCWLPIAIPLANWLGWYPPQPLQTSQKLYLILPLYLIAPAIIAGVVRCEKKSWSNYGLNSTERAKAIASLIVGIVLALGGLAIVFLLENACGWVDWSIDAWQKLIEISFPILLLALFISGTEELVFRGFIQTELEADYSPLVATIITSTIFALSHLVWDWENTLPEVPGLWLLGIVLTQARRLNRGNLGLACGLHAGWVWGLTCIDTARILTYTGNGAIWLTGWAGNPLAGASGILCLLFTAGAMQLFSRLDKSRIESRQSN